MRSTIPHVHRGGWLSRGLVITGLCGLLLAGLLAGTASAQRSTVLSGYVFGYDGKVLENATVTVYRMPQHVAIGPAVETNAKGEWSMDTGNGTFAVRAEHSGYGFSEVTVYPTSYTTGIAFMPRKIGGTCVAVTEGFDRVRSWRCQLRSGTRRAHLRR